MRLLKSSCQRQGPNVNRTMLWAAACTCFFGFLRSGEATVPSQAAYYPAVHLSISDISINSLSSPHKIIIRRKASKTDPFRQGFNVVLGRTEADLCPVAALLGYIAMRGLAPGPLFHFSDARLLTRQVLVSEIRTALSLVGVDPAPFSRHSFRIGTATTATAAGIEDTLIETLEHWRSSTYQRYIRLPQKSLASVSARLARLD